MFGISQGKKRSLILGKHISLVIKQKLVHPGLEIKKNPLMYFKTIVFTD